jgi:hypothetical protein
MPEQPYAAGQKWHIAGTFGLHIYEVPEPGTQVVSETDAFEVPQPRL